MLIVEDVVLALVGVVGVVGVDVELAEAVTKTLFVAVVGVKLPDFAPRSLSFATT